MAAESMEICLTEDLLDVDLPDVDLLDEDLSGGDLLDEPVESDEDLDDGKNYTEEEFLEIIGQLNSHDLFEFINHPPNEDPTVFAGACFETH